MTRPGYGPVQLAAYLGLERWQLSRAVQAGLVGGPDLAGGRWSAAAAAAALARAALIREAAGSDRARCRIWARSAPPGCWRSGSACR